MGKARPSNNPKCSDGFEKPKGPNFVRMRVTEFESNTIVSRETYITKSLNLPTTLEDIKAMDKLLEFKHDLKTIAKGQLKYLQGKKQELEEQLMGLGYNMEDRKAKFKKAKNSVYAIETSILKFKEDKNILHD